MNELVETLKQDFSNIKNNHDYKKGVNDGLNSLMQHFHELTKTHHNDQDLGKLVRSLCQTSEEKRILFSD